MASSVPIRTVVALVVGLLALPVTASGALPCLSACNPRAKNNDCCAVDPEFGAACSTYLGLRAAATPDNEKFNECVANAANCQPKIAGRCTVILGCVQDCRDKYFLHIPETQIQKQAFGDFLCAGRPLKSGGRRAAARACRKCDSATVVTSTTSSTTGPTMSSSTSTSTSSSTSVAGATSTTATTTAGASTTEPTGATIGPVKGVCFNDCIRLLDSVRSCYEDCDDACGDDKVARPICQRACRNASCLAIKARCTLNEHNPDLTFDSYTDCCCGDEGKGDDADCDSGRDDCRTPDEAECETTTTSTSTSSSTSSSTTTPTVTSTTIF
jgi:hypothetical protein